MLDRDSSPCSSSSLNEVDIAMLYMDVCIDAFDFSRSTEVRIYAGENQKKFSQRNL